MNPLPDTIPVKELLATHREYDPVQIQRHQDLYEGGEGFEARKDSYLRKRQIESSNTLAGRNTRKARMECADYTPHAAGLVDFLVGGTMQAGCDLLASDIVKPLPGTPSRAAYWNALNKDADGAGTDIDALAEQLVNSGMLHRRAYLSLCAPPRQITSDLGVQRAAGGLDYRIHLLTASDVDDWETAAGKLSMVRTHLVERIRKTPWGPPTREKHTWTFIDADCLQSFEADFEIGKTWEAKQVATSTGARPHGLGALPVIPWKIQKGLWVANRLERTALALFNREASLAYALDQQAFSWLTLFTNKAANDILLSETTAMILDPGDAAQVTGYDVAQFAALSGDCDRLQTNMFLTLQAMSLQAAAKDSNGRQSGVAKFRDFGSIAILLGCFAGATRDVIEQTVALIKHARQDDGVVEVSVSGLDSFDVQSTELKLKMAESFLNIQGIPDAAKQWVLSDASLAMAANAPATVRETIRQQAKAPPPAPAAPPAAPATPGPIRNPKTLEVTSVPKPPGVQ